MEMKRSRNGVCGLPPVQRCCRAGSYLSKEKKKKKLREAVRKVGWLHQLHVEASSCVILRCLRVLAVFFFFLIIRRTWLQPSKKKKRRKQNCSSQKGGKKKRQDKKKNERCNLSAEIQLCMLCKLRKHTLRMSFDGCKA